MAGSSAQHGQRTPPDPAVLDRSLAHAATSFGSEPDVLHMLSVMMEATTPLGIIALVGLGLHAARRQVLVVRSLSVGRDHAEREPASQEGAEFRLQDTEAARLASRPEIYVSGPLTAQSELPIERHFFADGIRRYLAVPLLARGELAGVFYVGFRGPDAPTDIIVRHCERLAQVLSPVFENYRTRERFARGDRRRATLIELSEAINQSLRLEEVLASAHEVICRLDGHCFSIIGLLDEDDPTFRAYQRLPPHGDATESTPPSMTAL